jgi:methyltransferase (TIGR00027 family)
MASKRVRSTAFGAATMKAMERHTPVALRLFDDPLAERLLTGFPRFAARHRVVRVLMRRMMDLAAPGLFGGMVCRTRAIDDATRAALRHGIAQVVILGAGLDTRAYRQDGMAEAAVWELDLPEVQTAKRTAVATAFGPAPWVRYTPIDLTAQALGDVLADAGLRAAEPTLLIWEGVSQYLPRTAVDATLAYAATLAVDSRIVFTYVPRDILADTRHAATVRRMRWLTGLDPATLGTDLAERGLTLLDDLGAAEYQHRYLRPIGRDLAVFDQERVAVARVEPAS